MGMSFFAVEQAFCYAYEFQGLIGTHEQVWEAEAEAIYRPKRIVYPSRVNDYVDKYGIKGAHAILQNRDFHWLYTMAVDDMHIATKLTLTKFIR